VVKVCYVAGDVLGDASLLVDEGGNYTLTTANVAKYGSGLNGNFLESGRTPGSCTNTFFGGDPDFGFVKHCWSRVTIP
jgi:hypothetical protein